MKVRVCDICVTDNKLSYAGWNIRINKGNQNFKLQVCDEHKDFFKGKTYDQVTKEYLELSSKPQKRIDLLFK